MFLSFTRSDGRIFVMGGSYTDTSAWGITSINGIGNIGAEITTENNAIGDGSIVTGVRIGSRPIDITACVKNREKNEMERKNALSFFNPKYSYVLYITKGEDTKWIVPLIEKIQCSGEIKGNVFVNIALKCPDPYFHSKYNYGKNIASVNGMFGFPYISPVDKGFAVGVYNFARQVEVINTGDAETYFTIKIKAFGTVVNPQIRKDGAYIRLIDTLQGGDSIDIDLVENTIKKNGVNCIANIDRTSSFSGMVMDVGDNTISFAADDGDTNMQVVIYYNLRYLGA